MRFIIFGHIQFPGMNWLKEEEEEESSSSIRDKADWQRACVLVTIS